MQNEKRTLVAKYNTQLYKNKKQKTHLEELLVQQILVVSFLPALHQVHHHDRVRVLAAQVAEEAG